MTQPSPLPGSAPYAAISTWARSRRKSALSVAWMIFILIRWSRGKSMLSELLAYTESDFNNLSVLMQELSGNIVFTRESLERLLADSNSHLYVWCG